MDDPADPLDDAVFAARQRRQRILSGVAVIVVLGLIALAFWALRPSPCDKLAKDVCADLLVMGGCEVTQVRAELDSHGADAALCQEASVAVDEATKGLVGDQRTKRYVATLRETLGFDPLNLPEPEPAQQKEPPKPMPVASAEGQVTGVILDEAHLYWSTRQPAGVYRVRNVGGTAQMLGQHPAPQDLWVSNDFVYWLSIGPEGSTLWADKKRGDHEPQSITIPEEHQPSMAAFMGPHAAYVDGPTNAIYVIAVAGGEPRQLREASEQAPLELVGDGEVVFWTTPAPGGQLRSAGVQEGPVTTLVTDFDRSSELTIHGEFLYWADEGQGMIRRVAKSGGEVVTLASDATDVADLAMDDTSVYWVERGNGVVRAAPLPGQSGEVRTVATGVTSPGHVLVDGAAIFWESGNTIFRLSK